MKRLLWVLLGVIATCSPLRAETLLRAEVDSDHIDSKGEITLTITVSGQQDAGRPVLPPLTDFIVQATGSRQNMVISGGVIENTTSYTYTLLPRKTGSLVIPPVTLQTSAGQVATQPITITVTEARYEAPRGQGAQNRNSRQGTPEPFFVEAEVSKDTVYLGEQLNYTFRYYRSASVSETNNYTPPQTSGFIAVDLPPQRKLTRIIGGETYRVVEVVTAMFPTRTGDLSIGPAKLRVVPDLIANLMGRDPYSIFGGQGGRPLTEGEPRNLATSSLRVIVRSLPPPPPGRPFSGAVGECSLASDISSHSVSLGDPVTVTLTVTGVGRKDVVDAPVIRWPEGLEAYPPTTNLQSSVRNDVVSETKVFSIALVARREGKLQIPAPELTYFNPATKKYETARGRELTLDVGPPRAGLAAATPVTTISASSSTIRYLKAAPHDWRAGTGRPGTWFVLLQVLPPVLVLAGWAWRRRMETPEARLRFAREREIKAARKRVRAVSASDRLAAAREISSAFRQYLVARFGLPPGELLDREWQRTLASRGCEDHELLEIKGVLDWTDRARFAGGVDQSVSPEAVLSLMSRLDRCAD
jgi:hypothetical protein